MEKKYNEFLFKKTKQTKPNSYVTIKVAMYLEKTSAY